MTEEERNVERDILWLYLSDNFRELVGIDSSGPYEGVPLDTNLVDELLSEISSGKGPSSISRLLHGYLRKVWDRKKSDSEIQRLIEPHLDRMRFVVKNAKRISQQAHERSRKKAPEDAREIDVFLEKREMIRRYLSDN